MLKPKGLSPSPSLPALGSGGAAEGVSLAHASMNGDQMNFVTVGGLAGDSRAGGSIIQQAVWAAFEGYVLTAGELTALRAHVTEMSRLQHAKESMKTPTSTPKASRSAPRMPGRFGGSPPASGSTRAAVGQVPEFNESLGRLPSIASSPALPVRAHPATTAPPATPQRIDEAMPLPPPSRAKMTSSMSSRTSPPRTRGGDGRSSPNRFNDTIGTADRGSRLQSRQGAWQSPGESPPSRSMARTANMASPSVLSRAETPMWLPAAPCDGHAYRLELESSHLTHRQDVDSGRRSPYHPAPASPNRSLSPKGVQRPPRTSGGARSPTKHVKPLPILEPGTDFVVTSKDTRSTWVYYDILS